MSKSEVSEYKIMANAATQALREYYQQLRAFRFNLNDVLDVLVTLMEAGENVHSEQQK